MKVWEAMAVGAMGEAGVVGEEEVDLVWEKQRREGQERQTRESLRRRKTNRKKKHLAGTGNRMTVGLNTRSAER